RSGTKQRASTYLDRTGVPRLQPDQRPARVIAASAASTDSDAALTSGSRTSAVAINPCACSTPLNTAGLGSTYAARTTGNSASAWARPAAVLPDRQASIIATNRPVQRCAAAEIVPDAPLHISGNSIVSSPPSTWNPE